MTAQQDMMLWDEIPELFSSGVCDLADRIATARATKQLRIETAFARGSDTDYSGRDRQLFDRMWLGLDLDRCRTELRQDWQEELDLLHQAEHDRHVQPKVNLNCLSRTLRLISFYCCFGSRGLIAAGRLDQSTEQVLLHLLWERTQHKNDIFVSRNSTWWMAGSENHDLNAKVCNLITSRIFMEEDEYKERIYPDLGHGDGIGNGEAGDLSRQPTLIHFAGGAEWADGGRYNARQHFEAWKQYFMQYFKERAKKGFFLENGSPHYMKWTISYVLGLYNFCGDEPLRRVIRMFLDLLWADWAVQQIGGVRGGPKTRHHYEVGGYDAMTEFARFYAGGSGKTTFNYTQQLIGDYEWPDVVWAMVFKRDEEASYPYISRGIGEERVLFPRPKGLERSMLGDVPSRLVKYSWVTPDYILGTQMDHPHAVYNHLAIAGRWQGLITGNPEVRIATVSLDPAPGSNREGIPYSLEQVYHSVQHRNVLITQQKKRWMQINPDWFPAYDSRYYERPFGIYIGGQWDTIVERNGWIFMEKENVFAAIRILLAEVDSDPLAWAKGTDRYRYQVVLNHDSYEWNPARTILRFRNKFSPAIIEAGSKREYESFNRFMEKIANNPLRVFTTVVTRETGFILTYKSCGEDSKEIVYNAANPYDPVTIAGRPIDYEYGKVFNCPYVESNYDSAIVNLRAGGYETVLNFNGLDVE